jgi:hypothetical protein
MKMRALVCLLLAVALPASGSGAEQSIELMFTPSVVQQALMLKAALKLEKMDSFGALALVGASAERTKAYADRVAGVTAVVVLGEDALKAAANVQFSVPIIVIEGTGPTAAKNKVIRLFAAGSAKAPASAKAAAAGEVAGLIGAGTDVALKGDVNVLVQAVLDTLK